MSEPKTEAKQGNAVNHPAHYNEGKVECIDGIESALNREEFLGFLRGNVLKYQWRLRSKGNPLQDLAKAQWYSAKLAEALAKSPTN